MTVGKRMPGALYVHQSAVRLLPTPQREAVARALLVLHLAHVMGAEAVRWNVAKLADGGAVSLLDYEDFDQEPHPALRRSVRVEHGTASVRDYEGDARPILHRKELLVAPGHPWRARFERLTKQEEEAGLLGHNDIGTRGAWRRLLAAKGLRVSRDHRLLSR